MNELALFAGAGGGLLATKWLLGWRTVCYVENAEYPVEVLKARIRDGFLDDAPIWDDVRTFDGRPWRGVVDCITAGFPCQPFSQAGKRRADGDSRNGWPDTIRIINQARPRLVLLENVPGLFAKSHGYFGHILGELAQSGYDARWRVLSAAEVGAPHKRDRVWVVAHANSQRCGQDEHRLIESGDADWKQEGQVVAYTNGARQQQSEGDVSQKRRWLGDSSQKMAHANRAGWEGTWECGFRRSRQTGRGIVAAVCGGDKDWWATEPQLGRVADGLAHRVDRLKAIGNGQVPAVAALVWELLIDGN